MAKKSAVEKNNRRRKLAQRYNARRMALRAIACDRTADAEERFAARMKLAALPRNANPTRIRNRCEVTGRPRAVYRKFRLCRNMLRELASQGQVPGVVKASW